MATGQRATDLAALESAMGIMGIADGGEQFDGEIADEDDGDGRAAVVYNQADDSLFDDAMPANKSDEPGPSGLELLGGGGLELLGGGGPESTGALIAYLEEMASQLEAQSGEEEKEIRGKIQVLRSVLEMRTSVVDQKLAALGGEGDALESLGSLQAVANDSMQRIEQGMGAVDSMLQDDDTRRLLAESAHVWAPAIGVDARSAPNAD